jgi:hypothetical protein
MEPLRENNRTGLLGNSNGYDKIKRRKGYGTNFATLNVRTMARPGVLAEVKETMDKYSVMVLALQEMRWKGNGIFRSGRHTVFYSGGANRTRGVGFVVRENIKMAVLNFTPVNERICVLRIKARFFNISIVCCYAPTEEADQQQKDEFYEKLDKSYEEIPQHDVRMIMGDFNAKVGKEIMYRKTAGTQSLHEVCNDNGLRLIDFAVGNDMVVSSTWKQRKDIHKATWYSPDGVTKNQIDHVLIERRHATDIMSVASCRGAHCGSDHVMVRVRYRQRISLVWKKNVISQANYDVEKLKSEVVETRYEERLTEKLNAVEGQEQSAGIEERWRSIKEAVRGTAEEIVGRRRIARRSDWYDEECRRAIMERNRARERWLLTGTRSRKENFQEKRRIADKVCRRKKREYEKSKMEEMEERMENRDMREFYKRISSVKKGFQPKIGFCKDKNGTLIGDKEDMKRRWVEYFSQLLNGQIVNRDVLSGELMPVEVASREDEGLELRTQAPTLEEVNGAIVGLKNNKAPGMDGIQAELIKKGGSALSRHIHQLIADVWEKEVMPYEWSMGIICPVHKKGDKTECSNYRGITLLSIVYKVFSKVLTNRMKEYAEEILGDQQCGFRANRSTTDQIFTLRQVLEKCYEFGIDLHHLFIDFKQAYDSVDRKKLYETMLEFGIPYKLVRLSAMTLANSRSCIRVEGDISDDFRVESGLRQGDGLSNILFNIALEKVIRSMQVNPGGTIYNRMTQCLAYADDMEIMARNLQELESECTRVREAGIEFGLRINENKTKYMYTTRREISDSADTIMVAGMCVEVSSKFKYLGATITADNSVGNEIRERIMAGNRCYFALHGVFKSRNISRRSKLVVYRTVVRPVVMYGSETWTLLCRDEELLRRWERKILRKIFGPLYDGGTWRIRTNSELYELYNAPDIISEIKKGRLRWLGHVHRMPGDRVAKRVLEGNPGGRRPRGRPRKRWLDDVEDDLREMGVRRWRRVAEDRQAWRKIVKEARALHGL